MSALLSVSDLSKSFGAVIVADETSFEVAQGAAIGILGPNGAGKTSLFNLITGAMTPNAGRITFDGADITAVPAAKRCKMGIARSFQVPQPFGGMTVFENALVGAVQGAGLSGREAEAHVLDVLEATGLMNKANVRAGSLSLLDRKRLEMARALAAKPKLLLLDEIAGGLTDAECVALIETIKNVHAAGTTIIWIEHVVHALLAVVEKLIVINFGKKIAEGAPKTIMDSPHVKEIYLGVDPHA
ncbi:amino acid/amide ABC transporter ATP-binding protein 1 (HAAT family) [Yoonia maricola]|uniref:Amino acid/amide ABC transporter ATP-binding protein 1 (HAAT family) n=1 Tax=Yoonia maricola TaxID=420999 RepID=A0A2M8W5I4_9RHOB|nr:ATP-binding cassette domain-containing protein [Yoonia maricola]PJI86174.1 amino acid/amide ABC transporter ATP-binding protein 1 (HAAT family) [Yoonia maricola]